MVTDATSTDSLGERGEGSRLKVGFEPRVTDAALCTNGGSRDRDTKKDVPTGVAQPNYNGHKKLWI